MRAQVLVREFIVGDNFSTRGLEGLDSVPSLSFHGPHPLFIYIIGWATGA